MSTGHIYVKGVYSDAFMQHRKIQDDECCNKKPPQIEMDAQSMENQKHLHWRNLKKKKQQTNEEFK